MKKKIGLLSSLLIFTVLVVACSPTQVTEEPPDDSLPTGKVDVQTPVPASDQVESAPSEPVFPNWYTAQLTDVNTGAVFMIEDHIGKVFLVETLATWCSNCLKQQQEVKRFHDLLGEREDFESLGINIDPNEDTVLLTSYVQKNGFDWKYVVATNEMIDEISALYGPQFLNPPSTPMLIIDRQGNPHPLDFGIKSAEELLDAVTSFL